MGPSHGGGPPYPPSGIQAKPIEGPDSKIIEGQHTFIVTASPVLQPLLSATYQPGITFVSTIERVGEPVLLHSQAPATTPGPASQPLITKEPLTAPPTYIAFCNYVFLNGLKEVGVYEIADALGYLREHGKPISKAIKSWSQLYKAIGRLMRDGVITRIDCGRYAVNIEACVRYANAIPQYIGNRDYVALRGHNSPLGLSPQWAIVLLQRQYFEQALYDATHGTSPTWPAQAIYPITRLATPSGHRPLAISQPDRYLLPSVLLLHRSKVYCVHLGPKPVCSATPYQLYTYMAQVDHVPYPAPVAPSKVVGPLADFNRQLIPLSDLPHNARKYELGYQVFDAFLFDFHQHFNVEVKGRDGLIYITFKSKHEVTSSVLAKVITALAIIPSYYLDLLEQALNAIADYGMSQLGLTTPELMARSVSVLNDALYKRPKPKPKRKGPVSLLVTEVRYRRNGQDITVRNELSLSEFTALLGELVDMGLFKLTYLEFTVAIPDQTGIAVRLLGAGKVFIYHNKWKDPDGAVRAEFRPYRNVTRKVTPQDLNVLFCGLAKALTVPIHMAKRAWARAW